jgi:hypothetical protein
VKHPFSPLYATRSYFDIFSRSCQGVILVFSRKIKHYEKRKKVSGEATPLKNYATHTYLRSIVFL